ncbi:MAG: efflux RND transporter periplasmic adaptor subunit [Pseudomonadota bacterium]|nr:efflux RND transporter periplasmic adaptor subunit [Pseudomonadota bacterium]
MKKAAISSLALGIVVVLAAGYAVTRGNGAKVAGGPGAPASAASGAGAPISVSSVRAQRRNVDVVLEATGTVSALNSVDVRSQVSSVITQVHIREGQFVRKGQPIFTLDSRSDEVNITKAKAQLAKDMAALADAQRQLARSRDLFAQNFISQVAVDTNQTLVDSQQAVVAADRAGVEAAQVGLSYSRIVSPTAGRAGAINVFAGSTVQPGGAALVTITQLDPIAVGFNLPQRNLADALQTLRGGGGTVAALLPEGRGTLAGRLLFIDNAVDAGSGTVRVKAQFANPDEQLWPGAFVNVRLAVQTLKDAVVVPQAAIIQGPRGQIVYVVDSANKAAARAVEVTYPFGQEAVVSGVQAGERIVVDGRQNLRPGATVVERAPTESGGPPRRRAAGAAAASGAASSAASGAASGAAAIALSAGSTP